MTEIWRRWRALPLVLLLCLPGVGEGFRHGDWELTSDERMVGGFTLDRTGSGVRFIVLLPYTDCSAYTYELAASPTEEWLEIQPDGGVVELTIDEGLPHRGRLSGRVQVDADRHRILIRGLSKGQDLVAELRHGAMLELDLWTAGDATICTSPCGARALSWTGSVRSAASPAGAGSAIGTSMPSGYSSPTGRGGERCHPRPCARAPARGYGLDPCPGGSEQ